MFEPGNETPPVIDTRVGRIGVLICYDLEFPEMSRMLALGGAELVAVPTNWPLVDGPEGERAPEVLQHDGDLFFFQSVRRGPHVGFGVTAESRSVDAADRFAQRR